MENQKNKERIFGLIGRNISFSFSKKYFTNRFEKEGEKNCTYRNFDIVSITELPKIQAENPAISGLNVTIPYKEAVLPYLDKLSIKSKLIGAVNVIRITKKGNLKGYNTDYIGFKKALEPLLQPQHKKALILGTGGASKAVAYALKELGIPTTFVSRNSDAKKLAYNAINEHTFEEYQIIINTTPLGTFPNINAFPPIPYSFFSPSHIAFDLIYNPEETQFLSQAKKNGAVVKNGLEMLLIQAEKAWKIWNR